MKKAQVTLFIIIAIVMLAAFGIGFYYLIYSNGEEAQEGYTSTKLSFDSDSNILNAQIQSCLADLTLRGIDYYGFKEISEGMIANYITISLEDCVNLDYFIERGYSIDTEMPYAEVEINDYVVLSSLTYPVEMTKGSRFAKLERFEFGMPREEDVQLNDEGIAEEDKFIVTEDNGAEFYLPEGVQALDADGNPVTEVKVKVQDRNVNGLANRVVIGNAIYEGLPSGATFSPALEVKFNVKYGDKPMYMDYKNLMCAYYDEGSDIWRTYQTLSVIDNGPVEKTYTVNCLVEHFTLMAVVNCGVTEYTIDLNPFFVEPIVVELGLPSEYPQGTETFAGTNMNWWFINSKVDSYLNKGGEEGLNGIHLYPEIMEKTKCILDRSVLSMGSASGSGGSTETPVEEPAPEETPEESETEPQIEEPTEPDEDSSNINSIAATHLYSGNEEGTPWSEHKAFSSEGQEEEYCKEYLLQDWDADDDPEKGNLEKIPENIDVKYLVDCVAQSVENNDFKAKCYELCRNRAMEGEAINALMAKYPGIDKSLLISGDGINDYIFGTTSLYCVVNDKVVGGQAVGGTPQQKTFPDDYDVNDIKECVLYEDEIDECINKPEGMPHDNLKPNDEGGFQYEVTEPGEATPFTMEWPVDINPEDRKKVFYATPKTWGYARTKATEEIDVSSYDDDDLNAEVGKIVLGGYGEFFFSLDKDGSACQKIDGEEAGVRVGLPSDPKFYLAWRNNEKEAAFPQTQNVVDNMCSDNCIWTLNDPIALGQLAGATVGEGESVETITVGQLKSGWNSLRVYVNNLASQLYDPVFYASGTLSFIGMGFASQDECETTLADRMNYLIKAGDGTFYDGISNAEGMEANCLYTYSSLGAGGQQIDWSSSIDAYLCDSGLEGKSVVNFQDPEFLANAEAQGIYYCACIAYTKGGAPIGGDDASYVDKCEAACDMNAPEGGEDECKAHCSYCANYGFYEVSPNGGKDNECPDRLDSSRDMGCKCGENIYDGSADKFCCAGQITETMSGGCRNGNMDVCCCKTAGGVDCQPSNSGSCNPTSEFKFAVDNPIFCDKNNVGKCSKDDSKKLAEATYTSIKCVDSKRYGCGWDQNAHTWSPSGKWTLMEDCSVCNDDGSCKKGSNGQPIDDSKGACDTSNAITDENYFSDDTQNFCTCGDITFDPLNNYGKFCCPNDNAGNDKKGAFKGSSSDCEIPTTNPLACPQNTQEPLSIDPNSGSYGIKRQGTENKYCTCNGVAWDGTPNKYCCDTGFSQTLCTTGTVVPGVGEGQPCGVDNNRCDISAPFCCNDAAGRDYTCRATKPQDENRCIDMGLANCPISTLLSETYLQNKECYCGKVISESNLYVGYYGYKYGYCCEDGENFVDDLSKCVGVGQPGGPCAGGLGKCVNTEECGQGKEFPLDMSKIAECAEGRVCCGASNVADTQICCKNGEYKTTMTVQACIDASGNLASRSPCTLEEGTQMCCQVGTICYSSFDGERITDNCNGINSLFETLRTSKSASVVQCKTECVGFDVPDNIKIEDTNVCNGQKSGTGPQIDGSYPVGWRICHKDGKEVNLCKNTDDWSYWACSNNLCYDYGDGRAFCTGVSGSPNCPEDQSLDENKHQGCTCGTETYEIGDPNYCCVADGDYHLVSGSEGCDS